MPDCVSRCVGAQAFFGSHLPCVAFLCQFESQASDSATHVSEALSGHSIVDVPVPTLRRVGELFFFQAKCTRRIARQSMTPTTAQDIHQPESTLRFLVPVPR